MWAIIGGTGFGNFAEFYEAELLETNTPFGNCSSGLRRVKFNNQQIIFLPRHGIDYTLTPSLINYRANIFSLKKLGVSKILAISAVGSLNHKYKPGDLVIPNQYINFTYLRNHTFTGENIVGNISLANPVTEELIEALERIQVKFDFEIHLRKTYVCIEGPYYSSRAESNYYRQIGADIIGMTAFPEYALAREAGICYLPCTFITDYDCWDETIPHVTVSQVISMAEKNNEKAALVAKYLIPSAKHILPNGCPELGLTSNLITPLSLIPSENKEAFSVILNNSNLI